MSIFAAPAVSVEDAYAATTSASSLGYGTNNQYPSFPPVKMADGRSLISSWSPESADNARILQSTGIASNWEYRKYLTASGADIMRTNFREMCNDSGYQHPPMTRDTGAPASFASFSDASRPFGYADSDLKQTYLTREQLQARKVAPVFSDFAR